ncbi:hypothetical protein [Aquamicrobium sp.]|uniref:hypothetical protein n=1 Tax=Aquamicrobium sp. TaxID=1872579 RepID=UPI00258DBA0F|nr:hypothetical protein [Aquamicrobium sp.]MCK9549263.1 hypothetical protein [Aquamicrobium sp.]
MKDNNMMPLPLLIIITIIVLITISNDKSGNALMATVAALLIAAFFIPSGTRESPYQILKKWRNSLKKGNEL